MSNNKHTPGIWYTEWDGEDKSGIDVLSRNGEKIVSFVMGKNLEEAQANAQLIASAPALKEENEKLKEQLEIGANQYAKAVADKAILVEALKEFIYNWEALGNANDYSNTATKINEALNQTK